MGQNSPLVIRFNQEINKVRWISQFIKVAAWNTRTKQLTWHFHSEHSVFQNNHPLSLKWKPEALNGCIFKTVTANDFGLRSLWYFAEELIFNSFFDSSECWTQSGKIQTSELNSFYTLQCCQFEKKVLYWFLGIKVSKFSLVYLVCISVQEYTNVKTYGKLQWGRIDSYKV